jgi:hypothetical protein
MSITPNGMSTLATQSVVAPKTKPKGSKSVVPGTDMWDAMTWAEEELTKCRKARLQFEKQWYTNLAFYFGRQYVQWTPAYGTQSGVYQRMYEPQVPPWRVRLITNKIRPMIRAEHSKLTKENPEPYVMPASTDDDDLEKASAAENLFEFLWRDLQGKKVMRQMVWWLCLTGIGVVKDWYDGTAFDSGGLPGAIQMQNVTPFHFYVPDVDEEELENQPCVFHVVAKSPDWVYQTYGVEVQPDAYDGSGLEAKFLMALGLIQQPGNDRVAVKEGWVKPCRKYPDGAVIIWVSGQPLDLVEGFPFDHQEYPFTRFAHIPTGRFYSESTITDLIPLQKEYNRTRSQIVEAKNRMAKPQLIAPKGSIDPNKITSEPGLIVFYQPGFQEPHAMRLEPLPTYVIEELQRCQTDMDDISGQHDVSKGQAPPGVTAATAISYLQEEDDSKLSNTVFSIENGVERLGKHILMHVQQFWDLPRTVRVVGTDGQYEAFQFSSADIVGNTDLNIQSGSAMPRSRAAKQAYIMQLGQMGWIPPDRALRYLDMAETGRLYEELQIDARQAQRENVKMLAGQGMPANTWDEHQVHILEHNNERKKQKFENSPDQVKQIFELHVQMHQAMAAQNAMQVQQQQMGMPGAPPGLPPGAGPAPGPPRPGAPPGKPPVTNPVMLPIINPNATVPGSQGPGPH